MSATRIAVAMSGGVDSSVAAALLVRRGRSVFGLTMQVGERSRDGVQGSRDAGRVASRLGFPHHVVNLEEEFRKLVLEPFLEGYVRGETPSPCVRCNTLVKFGVLLDRARALGAQRIATGHYAILERDPRTGRALLKRAADREKDQSYFLFDLTEEQRRSAEFPLGGLRKEAVRVQAEELGLDVAAKPDSQDLCFVRGGEDYRSFLERAGGAESSGPGDVVSAGGEVLGRHRGVAGFTVGQRRRLGVAVGRPLYVLRVEPATRTVVVGEAEDLASSSCTIGGVRWIPFERPQGPVRATVRIRSTHQGAEATIVDGGDGTAVVRFDEPQRAISPGQAAVAYDGDLVLGGGWIRDVSGVADAS